MNRFLSSRLAFLTFVLAGSSAFAAEAPKPKASEPPPFEVAQLSPNSFYGRFGPTNCSWIDTEDGVFVIDTGATAVDAKNLKAEIARTTKNKPIKWIAMTNLHPDSNDGFVTFLPTDATILVNARATGIVATSIVPSKTRAPHIIGIGDRITLAVGNQAFEVGVPANNSYTAYDLYVLDVGTRFLYTGGLVTTEHCPSLVDPESDLKGWIAVLARFESMGAQGLVPKWGNARPDASGEIAKTKRYLESMLAFLVEKKKRNAPEARVSGELAAEKLGDYCPREGNALNALSVYRRILNDGTTVPGSAASVLAPK